MVKKLLTNGLWLTAMSLAGLINLGSCTFGNLNTSAESVVENTVHEKKDWTFMVYMAADNNLEKASLEDFNEMEASNFDSEKINVIVLYDRNDLKDSSDSDEWSGTRMYEIQKDENGMNNTIVSKRISCSDLELSSKKQSFLNMGSSKTLSGFISNVKNYYPAEHYGLFVWGHGTGYRNANLKNDMSRAVALDDSSNSFMENCVVASSINNGMKNKKMDLIVYDTCFASELEVVNEFGNVASYFCGPQGVQKESGLNYEKVFTKEIEAYESGLTFAKSIENNLSVEMEKDFSIIDLSEVENVTSAFDDFAKTAASNIKQSSDGEEIKNLILKNGECFKSFESANNPVYVNVLSLADLLTQKYSSLESKKQNLIAAMKKMVQKESVENNLPLGIYFCSLDNSGNVIEEFSPYYYKDSNLTNMSSFVKKSEGYVLTNNKTGSLMDRIFGNYSF